MGVARANGSCLYGWRIEPNVTPGGRGLCECGLSLCADNGLVRNHDNKEHRQWRTCLRLQQRRETGLRDLEKAGRSKEERVEKC